MPRLKRTTTLRQLHSDPYRVPIRNIVDRHTAPIELRVILQERVARPPPSLLVFCILVRTCPYRPIAFRQPIVGIRTGQEMRAPLMRSALIIEISVIWMRLSVLNAPHNSALAGGTPHWKTAHFMSCGSAKLQGCNLATRYSAPDDTPPPTPASVPTYLRTPAAPPRADADEHD